MPIEALVLFHMHCPFKVPCAFIILLIS